MFRPFLLPKRWGDKRTRWRRGGGLNFHRREARGIEVAERWQEGSHEGRMYSVEIP